VSALSDLARKLFESRFLRFAAVGTGGFVVDEIALWLIHHLTALDYYASQIPAFFVAVTFTWWGNRTLTFREHAARTSLLREWAKFLAANALGAVANYTLYVCLLRFAPPPANNPYLALVAGTLFGLVFNFTLSRRFVFRAGK
jgi:putative flippase GtrA